MTKVRLASPLQHDSIVDGPGIRMVLWTQGCEHHCPGCHNPQTHARDGGFLCDVAECIAQIRQAPLQTGLTLSGGEPFNQAEALIPIVQAAKEKNWNVWAYSGFTFEQIMADPQKRALLEQLDVLVDGRFVEALKDYRLKWKGSKNQRIIDVPASLNQKTVVRSRYDDVNKQCDDGDKDD